ncbi:MAG: patatin-like phospholipase family protein [Haloarculaceae archaeon]
MSDWGGNNVAIACQGGGSHTAFTAGVLQRLLPALEDREDRLVGLSGTSGGAFSAVAGWYGHVADGASAPDLLDTVWHAISAQDHGDLLANHLFTHQMRLEEMGAPVPSINPYYNVGADWGQELLADALTDCVDFERLRELAATTDTPRLVLGSVNVTRGTFDTFADAAVTVDGVLASAAVPELYEAVEVDGEHYWDGLLSENPPIRGLYDVAPERKPEELWVIQINPQMRDGEPRALSAISDRRNELAGNLSLNQELRSVEQINEFVDRGLLPDDEYTHTTVRRIEFDHEFDYASKLNRRGGFVDDLIADGQAHAEQFLASL